MDSSLSTHRSTTTTTSSSSSNSSEFFICFNARRRLKTEFSARPSILSPARDPQISLSTCRSISSRSRRLRNSGSTTRNRGRSSPMFAGAVKKRGSLGFDNPEPSSPKVTCIGQVRVKTKKKKGIKLRRRHNGEVSFRSLDHMQRQSSYNNNNNTQFHHHPRNQRWVHLPSSICESFNCLVPCRPPCDRGNEKIVKKQEIEKLVEEDEEEEEEMEMLAFRSTRRHVFDKIEIKEEVFDGDEEMNVNVPPKNALLLMRFRSDPAKMEAIVSRCLETHHAPKQVEGDEDEEEESDKNEDVNVEKVELKDEVEMVETEELKVCEKESGMNSVNVVLEEMNEEAMRRSLQGNEGEKTNEEYIESNGAVQYMKQENEEEKKQDSVRLVIEDEEENDMNLIELFRVVVDEESEEEDDNDDEVNSIEEKNEIDGSRVSYSNASFSLQSDDDDDDDDISEPGEQLQEEVQEGNVVESDNAADENDIQHTINNKKPDEELFIVEKECCHELETKLKKECEKETSSRLVVDNLVLMMSDPKLSIDVCKETWMPNTINARNNVKCCDSVSVVVQQQKEQGSSAVSMSAMIEQKLQEAAVYEPFVLSRCKSAPIRYRRPDGWFWKNEGLELHSKVGAHGFVGFQLSR